MHDNIMEVVMSNNRKIHDLPYLIVSDFDGVMTDNRAILHEDGTESVYVSRADGLGVSIIKNLGIHFLILSTEVNKIVEMRAKKLDVPVLYGIEKKEKALREFAEKENINLRQIWYIGNDINDIDAMKVVGYSMAPIDAYDEVKNTVDCLLKTEGGKGTIREVADMLLKIKR